MTTRAIQFDLFGEIEAAEEARVGAARDASSAASRFLTETPWPGLIGWWLQSDAIERKLDRGEAKASFRRGPAGKPGWAWAIWHDGLRFEAGDTWQGWDQRPRWCIPWPELHRVRDSHPEVTARLHQLADGRGHPNSIGWRWWLDPFVLHPDGWHSSYLECEQQADWYDGCARPEAAYSDRLEAWRLALGVVESATLVVEQKRVADGRRAPTATLSYLWRRITGYDANAD